MAQYQTTTTYNGRDALASTLDGQIINVLRVAVGDGSISAGVDAATQTGLVHEVTQQSGSPIADIIAATSIGNGNYKIIARISSANVQQSFTLREFGIYISFGGNPLLFQYVNALSAPTPIDSGAVNPNNTYSFAFILTLTDKAVVQFNTGDVEGYVTQQQWMDHFHDPNAHYEAFIDDVNLANPIRNGTVPKTPDSNDYVLGGKNQWFKSQRLLTSNLNLRVCLNPDSSATNPLQFATIQAAHDYLLSFTIPANVTATISVDSGRWAGAIFTHPNSSQITLTGAAPQTIGITAIPTGTAGAGGTFNVTLSSTAPTWLTVGAVVYLLQGGIQTGWRGAHNVTAVSGNTVTLQKNLIGGQDFGTYQPSISGAFLWYLPTIVNEVPVPPDGRGPGALFFNYGINLVSNLSVIGTHSSTVAGTGVYVIGGSASLQNIVTWWWLNGLMVLTSANLVGDIAIGNCTYGMVADMASSITHGVGNVVLNGCNLGLWCRNSSSAILGLNAGNPSPAPYIFAVGNVTGVNINLNGSVQAGNFWFTANYYGLEAYTGGTASLGDDTAAVQQPSSNTLDLYAFNGGFIAYAKNGGAPPSCQPASGVSGNYGAMIVVS